MKIRTVTRTRHYLSLNDGTEIELTHKPDNDPIIKIVGDKMVVGYLVQDTDCENPLESWDGMGSIYSSHRHAPKGDHEKMQEALGLDCDWQRDPDLEPDPYAVSLDVYEHGGTVYAISGSAEARNFPDQQWDVGHGGAVWVPDNSAREECDRRTNKYGDKRRAAEEVARECVEVFNEWLAGDCWEVVIETYTADPGSFDGVGGVVWNHDEEDSCWGYIGRDCAESTLKDQMAWTINRTKGEQA